MSELSSMSVLFCIHSVGSGRRGPKIQPRHPYSYLHIELLTSASINDTRTMSDPSEAKQASVPQWQQQQQQESGSSESVNGESTVPEASQTTDSPPSRSSLVEQASRFLLEDGIKDAPTERKVAFLETKGLTQEEIRKLVPSPTETSNVAEQEVLGTEEPVCY